MLTELAVSLRNKIDDSITRLELQFGKHAAAVIVALVILFISAVYITPRMHISDHTRNYCNLASAPFHFEANNPMQYRILAPLLGYLTFLRGDNFIWLPRLFCIFFSISVFAYYRKRFSTPAEAVLLVCLLCFSNVYFFSLHTAGYTDIVSYFFIFLCYINLQRKILFSLFFMLAVFNHESNLFLAVPFFFHALYQSKALNFAGFFTTVLSFAIPVALYVLFRKIIAEHTFVAYDYNFYFSKSNISYSLKTIFTNIPLGYFYVFKLFWFFPAYYFIYTILKKHYKTALLMLMYLGFTLLQLVIAWDVTRLLCLCFPVMLFAAERVKELWGAEKFTVFGLILIGFNFLVPQYYIWVDGPNAMMPYIFHLPFQLIKHM